MRFSIGDVVILKENGEEATVISVVNSKIIEVKTMAGLEQTLWVKDVRLPEETAPLYRDDTQPEGFYLSFRPVFSPSQEGICELQLSFINRSKMSVILQLKVVSGDQQMSIPEVTAPSFDMTELEIIPVEQMNGRPKFYYLIKPVKDDVDWVKGDWFQHEDCISITPKKLFRHISKMKKHGEEYFEIRLAKLAALTQAAVQQPLAMPVLGKTKRTGADHSLRRRKNIRRNYLPEIDLHADKLQIPTDQLDNFEILSRQLHVLEGAIDQAYLHGASSLVIIHGIGKGKLKEEVHRLLEMHPQVSSYLHSWRPDYGYGATEAFLK